MYSSYLLLAQSAIIFSLYYFNLHVIVEELQTVELRLPVIVNLLHRMNMTLLWQCHKQCTYIADVIRVEIIAISERPCIKLFHHVCMQNAIS